MTYFYWYHSLRYDQVLIPRNVIERNEAGHRLCIGFAHWEVVGGQGMTKEQQSMCITYFTFGLYQKSQRWAYLSGTSLSR